MVGGESFPKAKPARGFAPIPLFNFAQQFNYTKHFTEPRSLL